MKIISTILAFAAIFQTNLSLANDSEWAEQKTIIVEYVGLIEGQESNLIIVADMLGSVIGYLKQEDEIDSIYLGSYSIHGDVSLKFKSGLELEGTHKKDITLKFKILDENGIKKSKGVLLAKPNSSSIDGQYFPKDVSRFTDFTSLSCHRIGQDQIYISAYWEDKSLVGQTNVVSYNHMQGIAVRDNENESDQFESYKFVFSEVPDHASLDCFAFIRVDKESGKLTFSVESKQLACLGTLESEEQVWFVKY